MSSIARFGLSRFWVATHLMYTALLPIFGGFIFSIYWMIFYPQRTLLIMGSVIFALVLFGWLLLTKKIIKMYFTLHETALEITSDALILNEVTIPFSKIDAVILGTSIFAVGDVAAVLKKQTPRFAGGGLLGPRLHIYMKDIKFSNRDFTKILDLCGRSFISSVFSIQYIIIDNITFRESLRSVEERIHAALRSWSAAKV